MPHIFKTQSPKVPYAFLSIIFILLSYNFTAFAQEDIKKDLQSKIKILRETPNFKKDTTYINLLFEMGKQYLQYNVDSLLIVSNESIKFSKAIKYPKGEIQGYLIQGNYYSDIGEKDQAIAFFLKALSQAKAINNLDLLLQSKVKLATEYKYKEDYAHALKEYLDGIEIAKKNNKNKWLSICYINISVIYNVQKEESQAILFLTKAMEINKKGDDDILTAKTLANLASSYIEIGDFKSATDNINEAISIFEDAKLDLWLTYIYELKAAIYLKQEKFNDALIWLKKSEVIHNGIDQTRFKIPLYTFLAKAYLGLKNYDVAEAYGIAALEISKKLSAVEERDITLEVLYKIEKDNKQPEKALAYLEELKAIRDTINKNNNIQELRILKSNLESVQEKEQYILKNEKKDAKQLSYTYISALIILAFSIIIIILKKNNKTQNILNKKLIENTEALKRNEARLNDANNTKNKLFSIIAHDLKGPINSFKSLFDLFNKSELTTTEFMEFMPQISENIDSIAFTLNNLLSWGQTQMNGLVTKPNYTTIKTLVDESIKLLSKQAEAKSITTTNNIDLKVITWCDKNQIDIVIRNLISNAVKFTRKHGTITIDASEKSGFWEIVVKDNGVGMREDYQINLFKEEETVTSYGTNNEKGTGLGIRVCKEMVKINGGTIWVESVLNQGSSFYFTIPKTKKL
ncbi:ATP-binding protein [Algibacter sp. L1A34]|uniref:ATP-binding protein n=1 Tax=Algibacter sp. L1A34 TaxID=2686365 RepID=UPI00131AB5F9|nr:ATP-binding protein [Algibacter sp. L1A34]